MRLLNTITWELKTFFDDSKTPKYAILSHTWGDEEVIFEDLKDVEVRESRKGFKKIEQARKLALERGFEYIWIDTCCIDKSSSAELSEAINSMFRYYKGAQECYAYLEDVRSSYELKSSRWFTRGWTLQELIAPLTLRFYLWDWTYLIDKISICHTIAKITRINESLLRDGPERLRHFSIAKRMSWAGRRQTTRAEDIAYCLMGIFDVNMPLLYGEGAEKAFFRLQEAIMADSSDHSLLSWSAEPAMVRNFETSGVLAKSPASFSALSRIVPLKRNREAYTMTNRGLQIRLPFLATNDPEAFPKTDVPPGRWAYGILNCHIEEDTSGPLALLLHLDKPYDEHDSGNLEVIGRGQLVEVVPENIASTATMRTIHIPKQASIRIETDTSIFFTPLPTGCGMTHEHWHGYSNKNAWKTDGQLRDRTFLLRDTDIRSERLSLTFLYEGTSTVTFAVFVQAGPGVDCGVCIEEFSEAGLDWLKSGETFKEWCEDATRRTLNFDLHCSLYMSTDIFVTATVRKEQRLGKECYAVELTILED